MKKNTANIIALALIAIFVIGGISLLGHGGPASQPSTSASVSVSSGGTGGLVGNPAPQFSLRDRNGTVYSNDSLKGKNVVLFFNEGIMCYPACWNQMVSLAQDSRFNTSDTIALSVVIDEPQSWQSAIQKMPELGLARVLFDADRTVSNAFGMLTVPSSMHYGSFPGHSFVLIDKLGIIRYTFDDPNMAIDNDRVFAEMQKLN